MSHEETNERGRRKPRSMPVWREDATGLLVTIPVACRELKIGKDQLYALINRKEIESLRIGKARRIVRASLVDYVAKQVATND